jgi:hypothetical protein
MTISCKRLVCLFIHLLFLGMLCFGQTYQYLTLDSALFFNSEQMGFGINGKNDGIKRAIVGPYKVTFVEKLDSGSYSTKVKEGKEMAYGSDNGYEEFKTRKFESYAYFSMGLGTETDSATCLFSYFSSYRKKTETVLSTILSKKEENSSADVFDENKLVIGSITIKNDPVPWRFTVNYPVSGGGTINTAVNGSLSNGRDSLRIDFVYADILKRDKKDPTREKIVMRSPRGYSLVDFENRQMAALIFKQTMSYLGAKKLDNFTGGELVIIGKENRPSTRLAIATLFAIMVGIR